MSSDLYYPFGAMPGEVLDPAQAAVDFQNAAKVAQDLSHWQWAAETFTDPSCFQDAVLKGYVSQEVNLGTTELSEPVLPDDGGADANIWKIPYNRGWDLVGNNAGESMYLTWASTYPELLVMWGWAQYARRRKDKAGWAGSWTDDMTPRVNFSLRLDGAVLPGLGPQGATLDGKARGAGYGVQYLAWSGLVFMVVPPGTHTLEIVAAQAPWTKSIDDNEDSNESIDEMTTQYVCVGNRKLLCLGLPMGGTMVK